MGAKPNKQCQPPLLRHHQSGFTLVELMVALVVSTLVLIGALSVHIATRRTVMTQRQVADLQQQLRGSLRLMEHDIRAAGYDPTGVGTPLAPLGIQDIRRYNAMIDPNPDPLADLDLAGSPALMVDFDMDADGLVEQHTYLLYDTDISDGVDDLVRFRGAGCIELVAEGIEAIGFAYAMDADFDDAVDLSPNDNIIWAVDSDNDNDLDRALDADDDGDIDIDDLNATPVGLDDPILNHATDVPVGRICMVRIWLLSRSTRSAKKAIVDQNTYIVGDQIIPPPGDTFRRRMMEICIKIRAS